MNSVAVAELRFSLWKLMFDFELQNIAFCDVSQLLIDSIVYSASLGCYFVSAKSCTRM